MATSDSGNYSLNVGSEGERHSNSMNFRVLADELMLSDNLSDAVQLGAARGEYRGSSVGASANQVSQIMQVVRLLHQCG